MKTTNWRRESVFLIMLILPWIIYLSLYPQLPDQIPTHYTVDDSGKWIVNGYMSPLGNMLSLSIAALLVYAAMTAPAFFKPAKITGEQYTGNWLFYFKLAIVLFITLIPTYLMIAATGRVPDLSDATTGSLVMVLLLIVLNGFLYFLFAKLKNTGKKPLPEKQYNIMWVATHIISSLAPLGVILSAQGMKAERLIPEAIFLFMAITGNLMYSIRPNRFIGIRTPWTLSNEEVWKKTHRIGAKWSFWAGVTGFIVCVFAPTEWLLFILSFFVIGVSAFIITYSYIIHKKIVG